MVSAKDARPLFEGILPTPAMIRRWTLILILVMLALTSFLRYGGVDILKSAVHDKVSGITDTSGGPSGGPSDDNPFRSSRP